MVHGKETIVQCDAWHAIGSGDTHIYLASLAAVVQVLSVVRWCAYLRYLASSGAALVATPDIAQHKGVRCQ